MGKIKFLFLIILSILFLDLFSETISKKTDIVFVLVPGDGKAVSGFADGAKIVKLSIDDNSGGLTDLTPGFSSAMDPDVSFDGNKILFSGKKKKTDKWQIWEMDKDGSNKKLLISGDGNFVSPLYTGVLFHLNDKAPTKRIAYINIKTDKNSRNMISEFAVYTADRDGKNQLRITYNLSRITEIDVFSNGRIIYNSMDQFNSNPLKTTSDIMAVNIDGTDNMGYLPDRAVTGDKRMVKVGPDRRIYFIENRTDHYLGGGKLSYILEKRPLHTYKVLNNGKNGFLHSPCPLSDNDLIVSFKKDKKALYSLYLLNRKSGKIGNKIFKSDKFHCIDTQILASRPVVRGRATFVSYEQETGVFYCIRSYISQDKKIKDLLPGTVKEVRVIEGFYSGSEKGIDTRLLGVAPVENDGSFHIEVPSERSLLFQLIDKKGKIISKQNSWTWVMPRESRGCIGCHEDRELAPPNHLSDAIVKPAVKIPVIKIKREE